MVAIIGAGPYGLSIAAHLGSYGVNYRIFGTPMHSWRANMPNGMFLKSEGNASNLFAPNRAFTLEQFCAAKGLPYAHEGVPVSLETFNRYGLAFQQRFVPNVEDCPVTSLRPGPGGFQLGLANGASVQAKQVVVATGVSTAAHVPQELSNLPEELLSHSGKHHDLSRFKGRDVTVIGGGQSALETAALLHEAGAAVRLIIRKRELVWNPTPQSRARSFAERIRRPSSKLGRGLGPWLYSNLPMIFRHLPRNVRVERVRRALGPAGAWWLESRLRDRVQLLLGQTIERAEVSQGNVVLKLRGSDGGFSEVTTSHIIAGTGYRFELRKLPFLDRPLLSQIRSLNHTPVLSANFESSVPGLYFTGLASANQFGPVMRFLEGARFTSQRVSEKLIRSYRKIEISVASENLSTTSSKQLNEVKLRTRSSAGS
jgi:hypothetical protein